MPGRASWRINKKSLQRCTFANSFLISKLCILYREKIHIAIVLSNILHNFSTFFQFAKVHFFKLGRVVFRFNCAFASEREENEMLDFLYFLDKPFWFWFWLIYWIAMSIYAWWKFNKIANDKGYEGYRYFWIVAFTGIIGVLVVMALPDKKLRDAVIKANNDSYTVDNDQLPTL